MNERSYLIKLIGNTVYSSKINTISYIIINVILTLLLVATTVLYNSLSALMTNTINNKIDCRTIFAKGYDESISRDILLESIKSANKHISTAVFQDYAFSVGEILEIKTSERDGEVYYNMVVKNDGNVHIRHHGIVDIYSRKTGNLVKSIDIDESFPTYAQDSRDFSGSLFKGTDLVKGKYTAVFKIKAFDKQVTKSINFKVSKLGEVVTN